ncbi:SSI family serine proteinase inhibitor [Streptomyces sp. NPDC048751]|uniref:SSI family serine proteinase inhibitor n=1 Tax=Streptomyces sp. NPDC048751 TaxID=3365591 RepID=UPI003715A023
MSKVMPQVARKVASRGIAQGASGGLRRLVVTAAASLAAVTSVPAGSASAVPASAAPTASRSGDHLTVTVRHAGGGKDGTYELRCHPGGGSHPQVEGACRAVERNTRWGQETFAPVPEGEICTMLYGGPATAHVTGVWAGRPVDATYDRSNGCQIARWDRFVPLLPDLGS